MERKQLTAGSTWHAAAGFHSLNGSLNMARLQAYSIKTYDEVAEISGQDVGMHRTGSVSCAATEDWWNFLQVVNELNVSLGIESHLIEPSEVPKHTRLIDSGKLIGAMYDPADGYLDPFGATHAYAKAAKTQGAEIYQQTLVTALDQHDDGTWDVVTEEGIIHAEHVVNAAGLWAREVGEMVGERLPLVPYEHHYLVTEPLGPVMEQEAESATTVDLDGGIYVREEVGGLLFGVYEPGPVPWALGGTPWTYGESALLEPRLDDLATTLERAFERFPLMQNAGIKNVVNGPFTFTPDGNPLVGPIRGRKNYWLACGCMAGFSQSGGIALALSQWMIDGEPDEDVFAMDPARFGNYASKAFTLETSTQFYERRFDVPYPNESWPAGRPAKTSPIFDLQTDERAVFAPNAGLEVPMWFARHDEEPTDEPSFFRPNSFDAVAEEVAAAASGSAIIDISTYSKFEISGPGARRWLDELLASRVPNPGRGRLAVMLSDNGRIIGDFTLFCLPERTGRDELFMMTGSGPMQEVHMRWFERYLPADGVDVRNITDDWCGFAVVGPQARTVLGEVTTPDIDVTSIRYLDIAEIDVGLTAARVDRVSLTGELGYEVWIPTLAARPVFERLMTTTPEPRQVGILAMLSMRLEKGFGIWGREFSPDYTPWQNDMSRFVALDKGGFVGRDALVAAENSQTRRLVQLQIDTSVADASGFEPVYRDHQCVGYITSGGYGHRMSQSLALGYLDVEAIDAAAEYEVPIVGDRRPARLLTESFDPDATRMRG